MQLLGQFGFNPLLFLAQVVNFLILVYLFKRFLYKPVLEMIRKREQRIQEGLRNAEEASAALEESREEREKVLRETRAEAERIISEAKRAAQKAKLDTLARSREEAERIIRDARDQAALEMEDLKKSIGRMAIDLSRGMLSRALQTLFTEEEKERILARSLEHLERN
jgi:F-type H+-transporting ATPase subunit b